MDKKVSPFSKNWFYILILLSVVCALYSGFIFSNKVLVSQDVLSGLDSKTYEQEAHEHFQIPTWFSTRLSGMPAIDAMFGDVLYPPSILMRFFLPLHRALGMAIVIHVFLAGVFFYIMMLKGFKTSKQVAFISALFYMINPEFISHTFPGHDGKMFVIAWLPFLIWRMKALMDDPNLKNSSFLGFGVGMCILTSHVQMSYFVLWGLFLYWVFSLFLMFREERNIKSLVPPAIWFWAGVFIGLGLSLVQLYPAYMFVQDEFSVRGVSKGFEYAASWSLHWPEFFSQFVPEFGNYLRYYWGENTFKLNTEYPGIVITVLAVFAVIYKPRPWRFFWIALSLLALTFAMGKHSPVYHLAYYVIPGVQKFRACSMIMFWYSFPLALLSGLFLKDVFSGGFSRSFDEENRKKWIKGLYIAAGGVTLIALFASNQDFVYGIFQNLSPQITNPESPKSRAFDRNFSENFVPMLWLAWFIVQLIIWSVWGVLNYKTKASNYILLSVVVVTGLIDAVRVDKDFIKTAYKSKYFSEHEELDRIKQEFEKRPFRCFPLPGTFDVNHLGKEGLESVQGRHDNELNIYRNFRGGQNSKNLFTGLIERDAGGEKVLVPSMLRQGNPFIDLLNVKYLLLRNQGKVMEFENRNTLGRISYLQDYTLMQEDEILDALENNGYDYRTTGALLRKPGQGFSPGNGDPEDLSVEWKSYTPNYREAVVNVPDN
ncbi:MAG: hypothetical protein ACOCSE_04470, partial [Chitinivibrionales bacterium]